MDPSPPTLVNAVFAVTVACLLASYVRDRRQIGHLARSLVDGNVHPRLGTGVHKAVALTIADWVYTEVPWIPKDPLWLPVPGLGWLGASPMHVRRAGGCCSGKSRLLICLLRALREEAFQITVYHRTGGACHALVAARGPYHKIILDPMYGFHYVGTNGDAYGLEDLRAGVEHGYAPLPSSSESAYPADPYYDFDFPNTRTAGWTRNRLFRGTYTVLDRMTGGRIDTVPQPAWMEWPQLLLIGALVPVWLGVNALMLFVA